MRPLRLASLLFALLALVAAQEEEEESYVTCGSSMKLAHVYSRFRLHSHEVLRTKRLRLVALTRPQVAYGSGSGQQSVTAVQDGDDSNSLWVVRPIIGGSCAQGSRIPDGAVFRLQHAETKRWLHSHNHRSPLSNQQEVSAYGEEAQSNTNDHWRVDTGGEPFWERDAQVYLQHADTGVYLVAGSKTYPRPIEGQREVAGGRSKTSEALWTSAEGVYFPLRGTEL